MRKALLTLWMFSLVSLALPLHATIMHATTVNGAQVTFSLESFRFGAGEPVGLKLEVQNQNQLPVEIRCGSSPVCEFWVTNQQRVEIWRYKGEKLSGNQTIKLNPLESKYYRASWNQTDSGGKPVQPGWYDVYAKLAGSNPIADVLHLRIKIDEKASQVPLVVVVPVTGGKVDPYNDLGKPISVEGILRQGPQGLYIEVRDIYVKR